MPKPKLYTSKYLLRGLKWKLEQSIGFKLSTIKTCDKLSELILSNLGENISSITLYRIFLTHKSDYRPYKHTLDLLSNFLDFDNWDNLQLHLNEISHFKMRIGFAPESKENLLKECIKTSSFAPMNSFFKKINIGNNDMFKEFVGDSIYESLLMCNKKENEAFFSYFASNHIVRASFFEYLADPDFLIKSYEFGLNKYFETSKNENDVLGLQDRVFSKCLLTRHYFKNKRNKLFFENANYLYLDLGFEKEIDNIHIFPRFRYRCYRLLYVSYKNEKQILSEIDELFEYILRTIKLENISVGLSKIIIHTFADTLNLIGQLNKENRNRIEKIFPLTFESLPSFYSKLENVEYLKLIDPNASTYWNGHRFN